MREDLGRVRRHVVVEVAVVAMAHRSTFLAVSHSA